MGGMKSWAFTHTECPVCGRCFLPWETKHKMQDLRFTTCSQQCEDESKKVFEEIADTQQGDSYGRERVQRKGN